MTGYSLDIIITIDYLPICKMKEFNEKFHRIQFIILRWNIYLYLRYTWKGRMFFFIKRWFYFYFLAVYCNKLLSRSSVHYWFIENYIFHCVKLKLIFFSNIWSYPCLAGDKEIRQSNSHFPLFLHWIFFFIAVQNFV